MVLSILFTLFHFVFIFLIFFLTVAFVTGAPYVPSTSHQSSSMIKLAKIKRGMTVYDLGSGDGRLLFLSAKQGARAIGYEINPFLVLYTNILILFSPYRKTIKVYWKSFWHASLTDADCVFVYLLPWKMEQLEKLLIKETSQNARIVSNSFIFPHLKKIEVDNMNHVFAFKRI
jgi:hypothetical protein